MYERTPPKLAGLLIDFISQPTKRAYSSAEERKMREKKEKAVDKKKRIHENGW